MNSIEIDMRESTEVFGSTIWDVAKDRIGGGYLIRMEGRPDIELAKVLDMSAGIDVWQVSEEGVRGIAARVQKIYNDGTPYNTFTVRCARSSGVETEYQKRKTAIESNGKWIFPFLTIQAYFNETHQKYASIGIAKTQDIIRYIQPTQTRKRRAWEPNRRWSDFYVVNWLDMIRAGYRVAIISRKDGADFELEYC